MLRALALVVVWAVTAMAGMEGAVRTFDLFGVARARIAAPFEDSMVTPKRQIWPHPYLGWARRPGSVWPGALRLGPIPKYDEPSEWTSANLTANQQGFLSSIDDYTKLEEQDLVVAIVGGSVADEIAVLGGRMLRDTLASRLGHPPEEVQIVNLAAGGFKQPQQMISAAQALLMGVAIDVVVNIDGYNEVAFGAEDSIHAQHPLLPSRGHYRAVVALALANPSRETLESTLGILRQRDDIRWWMELYAGSWVLSSLEVAKAVGGTWVMRHESRAMALERTLQKVPLTASNDPIPNYPASCLGRRQPCWDLIGQTWARASELTDAMVRRSGGVYLHVLQPNQYVAGSKPLSLAEKKHAIVRSLHAGYARDGYAELLFWGRRLKERGVAFHDLRDVFAGHEETLYSDDCCHYNERGNAILAEAIADRVGDLLQADRLRSEGRGIGPGEQRVAPLE